MEISEMKVLAAQVREQTGEDMYFCVRALAKNDFDVERTVAWFKLYRFDSHCFVRERK